MVAIPDFPDYFITEDGRVWSSPKGRRNRKGLFLRKRLNEKGYEVVTFHKEGKVSVVKVHRLVATAFISNPQNKPHVNHKDCNKTNNHISNLEWCTDRENKAHGVKNGLYRI